MRCAEKVNLFVLDEGILYYKGAVKNGDVRRQVIRNQATRRQVLCYPRYSLRSLVD